MTDTLFEFPDDPTPAPPAATVLSCDDWPTNGHLIADLARLGYLHHNDRTIDVTYGLGRWWRQWRPAELARHDIDPTKAPDGVADFRALPYPSDTFDVVAFDPPYINNNTRTTSAAEFARAYGVHSSADQRNSFEELWATIAAGVDEARRIVKPAGLVLVKAMAYTNGRTFRHVPALIIARAEAIGLDLVDEFLLRRQPGPLSIDPDTLTRGRRNVSTMLVFRRRASGPRAGATSFRVVAQGRPR